MKLTASARKALPTRSFAIPSERAYPIENASHARNALARVAQHGTPEQKEQVRGAVHRRFPGIGQTKPGAEHAKKLAGALRG